ncbi:hypothetical protein [Streptomyces sp. NPDC057582]|uniref:hypothetical protein n=1 Tax=Streptomyces sp. NPDC057582 TaxID=3346174 RepID=UPI003697E92F
MASTVAATRMPIHAMPYLMPEAISVSATGDRTAPDVGGDPEGERPRFRRRRREAP